MSTASTPGRSCAACWMRRARPSWAGRKNASHAARAIAANGDRLRGQREQVRDGLVVLPQALMDQLTDTYPFSGGIPAIEAAPSRNAAVMELRHPAAQARPTAMIPI